MLCNKRLIFYVFALLFFSCLNERPSKSSFEMFENLDEIKTGITFENILKNTPELNILTYLYFYNGAGVAVADFNNDNLPDLYFVSNQNRDEFYINNGNFNFKNYTSESGINNNDGWSTGITTVDINNDGLMDIYICKVGDYRSIKGKNLLYVNQGIDKNGIPYFKEQAKDYGLDFKGFSTQATFFDYDLDGDLDLYILNHSVHPNRNYGSGNKRNSIDQQSGDKLYRNDNGKFLDVSSNANIFQGNIGYGLGVSISDFNNDGYPDIYVGNDFFENDYLYINQTDGTFKELNSSDENILGHTSHFSMGNDIADINNDGYSDIISMDMLPEDLKTYKTSGLEYNYQIYQNYLKNGYNPQFMQNTLHISNGENMRFSEVAFSSGIASTEWSWSPLIADFDNDSFKDIYITNGILGATNDMDFISFIANEDIQNKINKGMEPQDLDFINKLPKKKIQNYFFKNEGNGTFNNVTNKWVNNKTSYSNGSIYSDLDNDGDLDIVVNNINEPAFILKNNSDSISNNNFIKLKFIGSKNNINAVGTKVKLYNGTKILTQENYTTRGYLSSIEPNLHFGVNTITIIDSLEIIWPDGKYETLKKVPVNNTLTVDYKNATQTNYYQRNLLRPQYISNTNALFDFKHIDQPTTEFNRDPLIPYATTNLGPNISISDINNDGLDDIFIGGSKRQASQLFIQNKDASFKNAQQSIFEEDAQSEDVSHVFFDANNDGYKDLIVVSGGNEYKKGVPLQPRLYINKKGVFVKDETEFKSFEINASKVEAIDFNNDSLIDICITSNVTPWQFGVTPQQYLFKSIGNGKFIDVTSEFAPPFQHIGNVQDMVWVDLNDDNYKDLIVVGHWMPISVFINNGKQLILQSNTNLSDSNGWYNCIKVNDFDKDGDLDIVVGNWGLNSRLYASKDEPITLYSNDFDDNGSIEPVVTYYYKGVETPFASKDELVKQMPFLNKKYLSYSDYANADFKDLLPNNKINSAIKKQVKELASCYFENVGNTTFKKHKLPFKAQISVVNDILIEDFNNDTFSDLLLVGNLYEISTQLGRQDASHGVLLLNDTKGGFKEVSSQNFDISGPARHIEKLILNQEIYYIVTRNNNSPIFLKLNTDSD